MSSAVENPAASGRLAHGVALITLTADDRPLEAWFPEPALGPVTGDLEPLGRLVEAVTAPYEVRSGLERYALPGPEDLAYRTFCGT